MSVIGLWKVLGLVAMAPLASGGGAPAGLTGIIKFLAWI